MPFSSTGLRPELLNAMAGKGYTQPTPVQVEAIPAVLQGRDVLACAPTGSGKTAAFALPLLQNLLPRERAGQFEGSSARLPRVLVLVPTRELAIQVGATLRDVANRLAQPVKVTVVFGGVSINPQMMGLRGGTDVVVATPGRLLDLADHNALSLRGVHTLVLDEADRMLDQAFGDEWAAISALLPAQRQNLLFSATFNRAVEAMAQQLLHDPVRISVQLPPEVPADITQRAIAVDAPRRTQLLRHLLTTERWSRVLVFVATQHAADTVAEKLRKARISAEPFHGGLSQGKRTQVLADFKLSRVKVVVATDVAARGLDIADLPVVVNFDLPRSADDHTHRIGRTGRAGATGLAISFVNAETEPHLRLIEKRHNLALMRETVAGFEPDAVEPDTPLGESTAPPEPGIRASAPTTRGAPRGLDPNGGIKGKRLSKKDKLRQQQAHKR
jgi:ATP-dependent RNA helicase RhlE